MAGFTGDHPEPDDPGRTHSNRVRAARKLRCSDRNPYAIMCGMRLLLAGIVGSTAYGLARPGSDVDRLGLFAAPTVAFHGLHPPRESIVTTAPDRTLHEAGKWCRLALGGNPTATELAWLPDELYETRTDLGDRLIAIRSAFLAAPRVRNAYLGYARQQFQKIESRGDGSFSSDTRRRTAKHARHLARLVHQGRVLYATGRLPIRLDNPGSFVEFGERVAAGRLDEARALLADAERDFDTVRGPLPEHPDERTVEEWLLDVRAANLPG
ncbi:DNA polymerase beta superfamily protein [Micromonospora sp. NPDC050397]|uniref:nucleotidyltransferase domain-containing protein n=1 Tax=Micromonospora sp. NPDC050397 TaxID=3364279 RepID=UPI0038514E62